MNSMGPERAPRPRLGGINPFYLVLAILGVIMVLFALFFSALFVDTSAGRLKIRIIYEGSWSGTIGDFYGSGTVEGTGNHTFSMRGRDTWARIQKLDDNQDEMIVQILHNDRVVDSGRTTEPNKTVWVSYSF